MMGFVSKCICWSSSATGCVKSAAGPCAQRHLATVLVTAGYAGVGPAADDSVQPGNIVGGEGVGRELGDGRELGAGRGNQQDAISLCGASLFL